MSETKETGRRQETPEERTLRLRRQRMRRARMRKRRRRALILRAVLVIGALALIIGMIVFAAGKIKKSSEKKKKKETEKQNENVIEMEPVDIGEVTHLSFQSLIAVPETAFEQEDVMAAAAWDQSRLTVEEFNKILQQLYDKGYVLISTGELKKGELLLPKGKKPLIISQQDVSYDFSLSGQGFASRIILDGTGKITNERVRLDGSILTGDFDVVSCVDTFVEAHPDFSHNGARGILGLTGYNGILGYRTDPALASSENNRYAAGNGLFDTAQEIEAVKPVIAALKAEGWEFACNGYQNVSYISGAEEVKEDIGLWKEHVGSLVGEVTILMYPFGTDIGGMSAYDPEDETFAFLKDQGFTCFSALDISGFQAEAGADYQRCNYRNLDGYRMYQDLYQGAGRFAGLLDFQSVYDQTRPSAKTENDVNLPE